MAGMKLLARPSAADLRETVREAAEVETLTEARRQIGRLRGQVRASWYAVGVLLARVRDAKLYAPTFARFTDFVVALAADERLSDRTLWRYLALADKFPPAVALRYDAEKLLPALRLLGQDNRKPVPVTLAALEGLKIRALRDGRERIVPFAEATPDEMKAALVAAERAALPPLADEYEREYREVETILGRGPGRLGDLRRRRRGKRTVVTLEVPPERLGELLALFKGRR